MNSMFITPPGIKSLALEGNASSRVGDKVVRNARGQATEKIELKIHQMAPLPISVDTVSPEPPYFEYFSYCDLLGGILLQCGSAEMTARIMHHNVIVDTQTPVESFNLDWCWDKYALSEADSGKYDSVAFMPGSNLLHVIDQGQLARLCDGDWYIKPHPITSEQTLSDLGKYFGYRRVFNNLVSGHSLFKSAINVATTQASEFFILAGLMKKPLFDLTKYEQSWTLAYQSFGVVRDHDIAQNATNMNRALMHPNSGWIHPDMSDYEIDCRIARYFSEAMRLRAPFKMVSSQKLIGRINNMKHWEQQVIAKQGPRLAQE